MRPLGPGLGATGGVGAAPWPSNCVCFLLLAPSDPLLCKFADGGPKKRQNQGKFVQNGRAWPRNGDMVRRFPKEAQTLKALELEMEAWFLRPVGGTLESRMCG